MLPWWGWLALWVLLLLGAGLLVGLQARRAWRSGRALTAELGRAGRLVEELEAATAVRRDLPPPGTAVTRRPDILREELRAQRAAAASEREARRAERMPPWSQHVH
ncbi:hypothetical protein H9L10_05935 [Phycicoccus endophyticus]|uniref:Uncharacterized protein n=1 Tax=Phycicoccus endophyticus TaxID=1690220 RepID=A0A7G9R4J7_9MICO|nr:hypothetical protein [Phycicoccus endophyticus]NHI18413.1 hypothetical protein [Phycicoccus endophyticus]QNN50522.1 hypothetical protein H9L10_05935 [Phycicoccus endophyticus]GGL24010.1 hypothetical protein GCM10012283_02620 [Phycicoccus endophyticus]